MRRVCMLRIRGILSVIANGSTRFLGLFTLPTVAAILGAVVLIVGLHQLFPPLAYIVPGAGALAFGVYLALPERKRE
jgi:hypothetical protein